MFAIDYRPKCRDLTRFCSALSRKRRCKRRRSRAIARHAAAAISGHSSSMAAPHRPLWPIARARAARSQHLAFAGVSTPCAVVLDWPPSVPAPLCVGEHCVHDRIWDDRRDEFTIFAAKARGNFISPWSPLRRLLRSASNKASCWQLSFRFSARAARLYTARYAVRA